MNKAYHIVQWNESNETAESRKFKTLSWYAKQNKLDGLGISRLRAHPKKVELLAGWTMIETLASRAWPRDQRGWLLRNGRPLTTADMAFLTSFPEDIFTLAVEFFSAEPMNWLEYIPVPKSLVESPCNDSTPATSQGESPGSKRTPATSQGESETQTDRQVRQTDRQTVRKNKEAARVGDVSASKAQFAALQAQVKELEGRGSALTPTERAELRKKRAQLSDVQTRQAKGDFSVQTSGGLA